MAEKLQSLEVGPKVSKRQRNNVRKEIKVPEKRMTMATPKSFCKRSGWDRVRNFKRYGQGESGEG